ncbi:MAG: CoA-binding protein [bacterium]|nr:CoA-binding protein [bacterium]
MNDKKIMQLLSDTKTIALIGISPKTARPSYQVMAYLQQAGYKVLPINPGQEGKQILGEKVYAKLSDIDMHIDIVDIFLRTEFVGEIVDEAIKVKASAVWMQLGIDNEKAAAMARNAGLEVVVDRCTKIEHTRLIG